MRKEILLKKMQQMTLDEKHFLEGAVEAKALVDAIKQISKREAAMLISEEMVRRDEAWSTLAHQIVGAESY
jgi:hypothetical protein